jgi:hypothetical protein
MPLKKNMLKQAHEKNCTTKIIPAIIPAAKYKAERTMQAIVERSKNGNVLLHSLKN